MEKRVLGNDYKTLVAQQSRRSDEKNQKRESAP
jgi:hypothetical protein